MTNLNQMFATMGDDSESHVSQVSQDGDVNDTFAIPEMEPTTLAPVDSVSAEPTDIDMTQTMVSLENFLDLAARIRSAGGMTRNFAAEGLQLDTGFAGGVDVRHYTALPSATMLKLSNESLTDRVKEIAVKIFKWLADIVKRVVGYVSDKIINMASDYQMVETDLKDFAKNTFKTLVSIDGLYSKVRSPYIARNAAEVLEDHSGGSGSQIVRQLFAASEPNILEFTGTKNAKYLEFIRKMPTFLKETSDQIANASKSLEKSFNNGKANTVDLSKFLTFEIEFNGRRYGDLDVQVAIKDYISNYPQYGKPVKVDDVVKTIDREFAGGLIVNVLESFKQTKDALKEAETTLTELAEAAGRGELSAFSNLTDAQQDDLKTTQQMFRIAAGYMLHVPAQAIKFMLDGLANHIAVVTAYVKIQHDYLKSVVEQQKEPQKEQIAAVNKQLDEWLKTARVLHGQISKIRT